MFIVISQESSTARVHSKPFFDAVEAADYFNKQVESVTRAKSGEDHDKAKGRPVSCEAYWESGGFVINHQHTVKL